MSASKIKNLMILILLLVACFLTALVAPARLDARKRLDARREKLAELYAAADAALDPAVIPASGVLYTMSLTTAMDDYLPAMRALLGDAVLTQDDSTRYLTTYSSAAGSASVSAGGRVEATLTDFAAADDPAAETEKLLGRMGVEFSWLRRVSDGSRVDIQVTQKVLGRPILSTALVFRYEDGRLAAVSGTLIAGGEDAARLSENACLSAEDALRLFLARRLTTGWVGSSIRSMAQGYRVDETASSAATQLTPVWRIATDTGSFLVDGLTGDVTSYES